MKLLFLFGKFLETPKEKFYALGLNEIFWVSTQRIRVGRVAANNHFISPALFTNLESHFCHRIIQILSAHFLKSDELQSCFSNSQFLMIWRIFSGKSCRAVPGGWSVQTTLLRRVERLTQKQPFVDVLQSRFFEKFHNIHRKTPLLESLFNKVAGLGTPFLYNTSDCCFSFLSRF